MISITTCTFCVSAVNQASQVSVSPHPIRVWSTHQKTLKSILIFWGSSAGCGYGKFTTASARYRLLFHTARGALIASSLQLKEKCKHITLYSQGFAFFGFCVTVITRLQRFRIHTKKINSKKCIHTQLLQSLDYHFRYGDGVSFNAKGQKYYPPPFSWVQNPQQSTKCQRGIWDKKTHDMQEYVE